MGQCGDGKGQEEKEEKGDQESGREGNSDSPAEPPVPGTARFSHRTSPPLPPLGIKTLSFYVSNAAAVAFRAVIPGCLGQAHGQLGRYPSSQACNLRAPQPPLEQSVLLLLVTVAYDSTSRSCPHQKCRARCSPGLASPQDMCRAPPRRRETPPCHRTGRRRSIAHTRRAAVIRRLPG